MFQKPIAVMSITKWSEGSTEEALLQQQKQGGGLDTDMLFKASIYL